MIYSIFIGLIAGWIANKITESGRNGLITNTVIGAIGGFIGSWLFSLLDISWGGLIGEIGTGVIGSVIFIWILNKVSRKDLS